MSPTNGAIYLRTCLIFQPIMSYPVYFFHNLRSLPFWRQLVFDYYVYTSFIKGCLPKKFSHLKLLFFDLTFMPCLHTSLVKAIVRGSIVSFFFNDLQDVFVRLNLFNHVLALFHANFSCNLTIRYHVFRWELCKGSV